MKKTLLLSLSLAIGFSSFAQQRIAKNELSSATAKQNQIAVDKDITSVSAAQFAPQTAKSVVVNRYQNMEYSQTMWTHYDLQSNQYCANRMYQLSNGSIGVVATMSHEPNQVASDRGTGYNFFNGSNWQNEPDNRIENFKTGWPTIAQWGSNGEILLCHGNGGIQCFTRTIAGQGAWVHKSTLPACPIGYPYNEYATWPRVVTSGDNHNIVHVVACLQHTISDTEGYVHTVLYRSEDATNWEVSYGPLQELGYEQGSFSADDYCMAANGHNVAILYSGCLTNSIFMFKSTDDGLTWETFKVWEHPFENVSLEEPDLDYGDTLFMPMNGSIAIDNHGVAHVALNVFEMSHLADTDPGYYSYWYGRFVDGILYWNDTQEAPMRDTYHEEYVGTPYEEHFAEPNPFHVGRLWWPVADDPGYIHMLADSTKWIGWVPAYQGADWDNSKFYHESDYHSRFYGASGHPALSIDPQGNLACAYSSPCMLQENENDPYYKRHIYVSYRNVNEGYWNQIVDDITDPEEIFELSGGDNIFTISVPNTINDGEFWFGFQSDYEVGLYWGSNSTQTSATENGIFVMKVIADPEMVGSVTNYTITATPNPSNGGTVSGAGSYSSGSTCTLHAYPNNGYSFVKWTKNGTQVSTNPNYSFTVTGNASYVAHFQQTVTNYTISLSASPTNGGSVYVGSNPGTTQASFANGQSCTVHASANSGYTFTNWTENGTVVSSNANYTFTVNGNRNLVANFSANAYTINVSASPTNGGSVYVGNTPGTTQASFTNGQSCTVHASANPGYTFTNWTENGSVVSSNANYTFTVNSNRNLVANFSANAYTISVSASPTNVGSVYVGNTPGTTQASFTNGQSCTVHASANSGYTFTNWTENGNVVSSNANYTFTVNSNRNLVANFTANEAPTYTVTANAEPSNGGTITGAGTYPEGETCVLLAIPNDNYIFENWTRNGIVVSRDPRYEFPVNRDLTFVAHFTQDNSHFTITAMADPIEGGSVSGGGTYESGATCTLNAIAADGYEFVNWTSNGISVSSQASFSVSVTSNAVYVAHFRRTVNHYTVTVNVEPTGAGSVIGASTFEEGATCTLIPMPNPTYSFVCWTENGIVVSTDNPYSFTVVQSRSLVAVFSQGLFYTISASAGPNGTISPEGEVMVMPGEDKTFAIIPDEGCSIIKVIVDGVDRGALPSYTFRNVNENHSIHVQFSGLSVDDNVLSNLKIYPNPANDKINIESPNMKQVAVFNLLGVKIISKDVNGDFAMVNTDGLPSGTYILKVEYHDGSVCYSQFVVAQ